MNPLSIFRPDRVCEQTLPDSMWYVAKKAYFAIFLEIFNEVNKEDGDDEAIVCIYKNDELLPSYGGTLKECLKHVKINLADSQ